MIKNGKNILPFGIVELIHSINLDIIFDFIAINLFCKLIFE